MAFPTRATGLRKMYLSGSKWNMRKKRRRANPWRILLLLALIGGAVYLQRFVVPSVPPLFVPTATPTRSPASYMLVAQSLFQAGKLSQAEDAYRQAIEADPQQATPYLELARVQVFAGQYQDAETTARDGLLINPDSAIGHAVHGWTLDFLGKDSLVDAQREVESALSLDPNLALAHAYYAEVLIDSSLDNYKKALDEAQRAVQMDPNMLEAHRALGYVWENTQNYDQALQEYSAALRINPNLAPLHIAVGNMYFNLGDTNKATESYLKASSLDPTNSEPLTRIAQAYARVGEYGKASQYAANAVEQRPSDPYLHGDLGRMFYKNNELDKAVSELTLAVRGGTTESGAQVKGIPMDPGDSRGIEFYWTYGLALAKTQQCGVAVQIFQALVQVVKDDDTTIANATQGLVLCGVIQPTATPRATAAP